MFATGVLSLPPLEPKTCHKEDPPGWRGSCNQSETYACEKRKRYLREEAHCLLATYVKRDITIIKRDLHHCLLLGTLPPRNIYQKRPITIIKRDLHM